MNRLSIKQSIALSVIILGILVLTGCSKPRVMVGDNITDSYTQITQDEAREMMLKDDGHIILDVRRQDEYDAGHIKGAILIPNESITTERPEELPDPDQIILVYCRSGRRSKEASQKLFDMGYTNIYEFGGINTWTGEIVTEEAGEEDVADAGEIVTENPDAETVPEIWEDEEDIDWDAFVRSVPTLVIEANGRILYADLEENDSAQAFVEKLSPQSITIEMHDYGDFEKVGTLPWSLPQNDQSITTEPGDIILYQGDQITIYYDQNTWELTKLAEMGSKTREDLLEVLGDGDVTVNMWLEWSE